MVGFNEITKTFINIFLGFDPIIIKFEIPREKSATIVYIKL